MPAKVKLRFFFNPMFIMIINQNNRVGFERAKKGQQYVVQCRLQKNPIYKGLVRGRGEW